MDFFDVAHTQRAMRRLKPDPVSDEDIWKILDTAIRAPSGGNVQPWNFLVVRDPEKKRKIGEWYLDAWDRTYGPLKGRFAANPATERTYNSSDHLARNIASVPVLIFALMRKAPVDATATAGASIYPAVQNLMLAARALGLGSTLTTLHRAHESEVKALLGIPDDTETMAMIPIGYPLGRFGPSQRRPVDQVTFWETWGTTHDRDAR